MSTESEQQKDLWGTAGSRDRSHGVSPQDFACCFSGDDGGPVLNEATRAHLFYAAQMLVDQIDEDLYELRRTLRRLPDADVWTELNWTKEYLPPAYAASYDVDFLRHFHWSVLAVVHKLGGEWLELSSVAEELAMNALLRCAITLIDLRGDFGDDVGDIDFDDVWDLAFWDLDFQMLFMGSMDGVQDTAYGRRAGMANLDRSEWFNMFDGARTPPHPMTWRDPQLG